MLYSHPKCVVMRRLWETVMLKRGHRTLTSVISVASLLLFAQTAYAADAAGSQLSSAVINFVNNTSSILTAVVGSVAILLTIYAGFLYMTATGNPQNIEKAKSTMKYVVVGIVDRKSTRLNSSH